jgi:hypothetical protein
MSRVNEAFNDIRAYYGGGAYIAFLELLHALEEQYKDDLVTAEADRFARKQAAALQVRNLRMALIDKEGGLSPTI